MIIKTIHGPRTLRVELLDDPATPVMVYLGRRFSATYECACATGTVEDHELDREQLNFLAACEEEANEHYDKYKGAA
jgi:hypothetical protein